MGRLWVAVMSCILSSLAFGSSSIYVSLVEKDSVHEFLNRFATNQEQLVVTTAPIASARASVAVERRSDLETYVVEGALPEAKLPGEVARLGGFAVVTLPFGKDPHDALGTHALYAEKIARTSTKVPRARTERLAEILLGKRGAAEGSFAIDPSFLEARLKEFSGAVPVTVAGRTFTISERRSADGRANARAWLRAQYEALGFYVQDVAYGEAREKDPLEALGGTNLTAEKVGIDPTRVLIISAHLDSVGNAGADDDGAGTVSALAIANALKDKALAISLRIVAFDQEENGLVGSAAYARALDATGQIRNVVGVLNLEMTGYDSDNDGGFHVIDCNENTSAELTAKIDQAVAREPIRLRKVDACTNRSDHASFWRYGVPAVVVSENFFGGDGNPCYHRSCDKVDSLNWDYMTKVTRAVGIAAADILAP